MKLLLLLLMLLALPVPVSAQQNQRNQVDILMAICRLTIIDKADNDYLYIDARSLNEACSCRTNRYIQKLAANDCPRYKTLPATQVDRLLEIQKSLPR